MIKRAAYKKSSTTVEELCELATEHKVTTLFIMPTCQLLIDALPDSSVWDVRATYREGTKKLQSLTGWKKGSGYKRFTLVFLKQTLWYGTEKDKGPLYGLEWEELKKVLEEVEDRTGIALQSSPQSACWKLACLLDSRLETKEWLPQDYHFTNQASQPLQWNRCFTEQEQTQGCFYLHKWDVRGAYLGASQSLHIGYGMPIPLEHTREEKKTTVPTIWETEVLSRGNYPYAFPLGTYWLIDQFVETLEVLGFTLRTTEGYMFLNHGVLLQKWSKVLWEAREQTTNPHVKACIRLMYTSLMGTLGSDKVDAKDPLYRPDIRSLIIGTGSLRRAYRIQSIHDKYGLDPLMVYTDALYYLSSSPVPYDFFNLTNKGHGYEYQGYINLQDTFDYSNKVWGRFKGNLAELFTAQEGASNLGISYKLEILNSYKWRKS